MRYPTERANRGSQKWIQDLVNTNAHLLSNQIQLCRKDLLGKEILWISPLQDDNFAEYRDGSFLDKLGLSIHTPALQKFWPARGPQWDGLGKTTDGSVYLLIEAKANIPEIVSNCGANSDKSLKLIKTSLEKTQEWVGAGTHICWTTGFYQYANRLAHLYFLNQIAGVRTYLISLYFVNDTTYIPTESQDWNAALKLQKILMGINNKKIHNFVIDIFLNTGEIK